MDKNKKLDDFFKPKENSKSSTKNNNSTGKRKAEDNLEIKPLSKRKKSFSNDENNKREEKLDEKIEENIINSNLNDKLSDDISLNTFETFINGLDTWKEPLKKFTNSDKMKSIYKFIVQEYKSKIIYPPQELIFNAFQKTHWNDLKIVILGQDPYPNKGQGMGLSFSVNRGVAVPKSLVNIYKCLEKDKKLNFKSPSHGDLTKWAQQGVFLLNATLTVVDKSANSHQKTSGWSEFTDFVIKTISDSKKGIIFLLWGNFAIAKKKLIDAKKHHIIENIHPSPLAASKADFTISDQFSKANEYLIDEGMLAVDWNLDK
jgi:uracil-DNA glycosylase